MKAETEKNSLRYDSKRRARIFQFKALRAADGWISPAYVSVDDRGIIEGIWQVAPEGAAVENVNGFALPGFQNSHSHAFQYAMAGIAEQHAENAVDDFWTWREAMYA